MANANSITQLVEQTNLDESSLMVVAQQDMYISQKYNTCQIKAKDVIDVLKDKVIAMMDLDSAAFCLSDNFSLYDHNHDTLYNKLSLEYAYNLASSNENMLSIGNTFVDGSLSRLCAPNSFFADDKTISFEAIEPRVGMLKVVAKSKIETNKQILHKDANFDGWLYPDGSTYQLTDFMLSDTIASLYGNADGKTFTLPILSGFAKMNGKMQKQNGTLIAKTAKHNALLQHNHMVDIKSDVDMEIVIKLPACKDAGNGGKIHQGNGHINASVGSAAGTVQLKTDSAGNTYKLSDIIKKGNFNNKYYLGGTPNIDNVENLLKIADEFNGYSFYDEFKSKCHLDLGSIKKITIQSSLAFENEINVQQAGSNDDETYPAHIILPVMIYVGQRKRKY